jgi:hypothetical protein
MHPPGAADYVPTLQSFLSRANQFNQMGRFQWYTMTDLAQFLSQREKVSWSASALPDGTQVFQASHPVSLQNFTWLLPKANYAQPVVTKGTATISAQYGHVTPKLKKGKVGATTTATASLLGSDDEWVVVAEKAATLEFTAKPINP